MSRKLDCAEESIQLAAKTAEDTLPQVVEVEDRVSSKLGDLSLIGERLMDRLAEHLTDAKDYIRKQVDRGINDNERTRELVKKVYFKLP